MRLVLQARQIIASCFFFDVIQPPIEGESEKLLCKGMCWDLDIEDLVMAETGQARSNAGSLTLIFTTLVNISME